MNTGEDVLRLAAGTPCTLTWGNQRHAAEILGVSENTIWTSFPPLGENVEDLGIDVQLGTGASGPVYHTQVVIGPREPGDGVVLRRTASAVRRHSRDVWRVPTNLAVRYRIGESAGVWIPGRIANLSLQGALMAGDEPMEVGDSVTLEMPMKDGTHSAYPSLVVHTNPPEQFAQSKKHWLGLRFQSLTPQATRDLTWYLWERVWRLYPDEAKALYPRRKKRKRRAE